MLTLQAERLEFPVRRETPAAHVIALVRALIWRVRQLLCAVWHGHEMVMHFEPERLSLQCMHCGFESPGWAIGVEQRYARKAAAPVSIALHRERRLAGLGVPLGQSAGATHRAA